MTKDVKNLSEIIKGAEVPLEYKKKEMARLTKLEEELQAKHARAEEQSQKLAQDASEVKEQIAALKQEEIEPTKSMVKDWFEYRDYFIAETMDPLIKKFISLKEEYEKTGEELVLNYRKIEGERKRLVEFMRSQGIEGEDSVGMAGYRFDRERMKKGFIDTQGNQNFNDLMYFSGM